MLSMGPCISCSARDRLLPHMGMAGWEGRWGTAWAEDAPMPAPSSLWEVLLAIFQYYRWKFCPISCPWTHNAVTRTLFPCLRRVHYHCVLWQKWKRILVCKFLKQLVSVLNKIALPLSCKMVVIDMLHWIFFRSTFSRLNEMTHPIFLPDFSNQSSVHQYSQKWIV